MLRVLITRSEEDAQPFVECLDQHDLSVTALSFINFSALPFDPEITTDWLFFYSQKGVEFFLKEGLDVDCQIAAYGPSTAAKLTRNGLSPDFVGDGSAPSTALRMNAMARGASMTFVKGAESMDALKKYMDPSISLDHRIVYQQAIHPQKVNVAHDILVFTSPLNFEGYIRSNSITANQKVLAIGTTTATAILNHIEHPVYIAKKPSMVSLADLVISTL